MVEADLFHVRLLAQQVVTQAVRSLRSLDRRPVTVVRLR